MAHTFPDDPKPFKVLESTYIFERPPWLVIREERLQLPAGGIIDQFYVFDYPAWVNVIALTEASDIVMIRQYRHGIGKVYYEIPAGVSDAGETTLQAAQRELLEETGFGGGEWQEWMQLCANPAIQSNLTYTFLARGVKQIAEQRLESTEDIKVHLMPVAEVKALILQDEIIQALHAAPLLKFLLTQPS
jgi:8-oxo-dGDP phosphatase